MASVDSRQRPLCPACGAGMELTLTIPPFGSQYALKIYTCPKCGRTEDYLVAAPSQAA